MLGRWLVVAVVAMTPLAVQAGDDPLLQRAREV